jgi:serine/threonine-protein kinase RsbW
MTPPRVRAKPAPRKKSQAAPERAIESGSAGYRVELSVRLPRDAISVPVIRHLTRRTLEAVGVTTEVRFDIELALTEACSNVLRHAGPGDAYDVNVSVRPDECELRVVDVGHGFDHATIQRDEAHSEAERGRGLGIMHALVDEVDLVTEPTAGTLVRLVKQLEFDEGSRSRHLLAEALQPRG